jgi:hypothetical protein
MTEAKLKQIFGNIEEIIMTSHSFLRTLYKNIPDDFSEAICIGQIFLDFVSLVATRSLVKILTRPTVHRPHTGPLMLRMRTSTKMRLHLCSN